MNENKYKHMDYIQDAINRMAGNSFQLKSWIVTIIVALLALSLTDGDWKFHLAALVPIIAFWGLDSFFLRQERLVRKLYDYVRKVEDDKLIDFSMDTTIVKSQVCGFWGVFFSKTMLAFYIPFFAFELFMIFIFCKYV